MQALNAAPRDALTTSQVEAVLTADEIEVAFGLELLDPADDRVLLDLSDDFLGGEIERHNKADVHGTCRLSISQELSWATARVRPYMTIAAADTSTRYNLGVYLLATPERQVDEDLVVFDVQGYDKLSLLQPPIGDTYVVASGTAYLTAAKATIAAAGAGTRVLFDGTAQAKTLPDAMVWALADSDQATYLDVVNDLLAAVGYGQVWVDQDGYFRASPIVSAKARPVEWTFDVDDDRTSLVDADRVDRQDGFDAVNYWRFITKKTGSAAPAEGSGFYTVTNDSDGAFSISALGRTVKKVVYLDAADQASLVAQGDAIVQEDRQHVRTLSISTAPLPIAGHLDVVAFQDAALGGLLKTQVREWSLPLDGSDMTWTLEVV